MHTLGAEPNGLNINDGVGSTHPEQLQKMVVDLGADLGIAHDGDADRCLAVDADGQLVDGDQILAICALALREAGQLTDDTVVSTVMANLGFKLAMADQGVRLSRRSSATATCSRSCCATGSSSAASSPATCCSPGTPRPATAR